MRSTSRIGSLVVVTVAAVCTVGLVARAYSRRLSPPMEPIVTPARAVTTETFQTEPSLSTWASYSSRLSLEPSADRMRMLLGTRFSSRAKQVSYIGGTLLMNSQSHVIRIVRSQEEEGEIVDLALDAGPFLRWNEKDGVTSPNGALSDELKTVLERIVLSGPDQFVLAQLRGASYYTVATGVVPEEAPTAGNYSGPVWNVVRVQEPTRGDGSTPEGRWRMNYINSVSGLIDRIILGEPGGPVMVELTEWTSQDGELQPGRIRWSRNKQVLMELATAVITYGPK